MWNPDASPTSSTTGPGACKLVNPAEVIGACTGDAAGHWDGYAMDINCGVYGVCVPCIFGAVQSLTGSCLQNFCCFLRCIH